MVEAEGEAYGTFVARPARREPNWSRQGVWMSVIVIGYFFVGLLVIATSVNQRTARTPAVLEQADDLFSHAKDGVSRAHHNMRLAESLRKVANTQLKSLARELRQSNRRARLRAEKKAAELKAQKALELKTQKAAKLKAQKTVKLKAQKHAVLQVSKRPFQSPKSSTELAARVSEHSSLSSSAKVNSPVPPQKSRAWKQNEVVEAVKELENLSGMVQQLALKEAKAHETKQAPVVAHTRKDIARVRLAKHAAGLLAKKPPVTKSSVAQASHGQSTLASASSAKTRSSSTDSGAASSVGSTSSTASASSATSASSAATSAAKTRATKPAGLKQPKSASKLAMTKPKSQGASSGSEPAASSGSVPPVMLPEGPGGKPYHADRLDSDEVLPSKDFVERAVPKKDAGTKESFAWAKKAGIWADKFVATKKGLQNPFWGSG
mmetsp:Transcript_134364/g.199967  ORF Transcript_134364/g.199967 Transcript_134364/m.199967 type:complete len:436 (+) Transcript_134364:8-1315(+)